MKIKNYLKILNERGFSHDLGIVAFAVVFAIIGVGYIVASHADSCKPTLRETAVYNPVSSPVCQPVANPVSSPSAPSSGEQLSQPPARRPAQYLHVCISNGITYVSQGTPACLMGGAFQFDYAPTVPGTYYNVPCGAINTTSPRYVYISSAESCPSGTTPLSLAPGEQLSKPPARRPAQYLHVCVVGKVTYVTQGTPNCLPGGVFQFNYAPTVPGTVYSIPCQTTSNSLLRYAYISSSESCPSGTVAAH